MKTVRLSFLLLLFVVFLNSCNKTRTKNYLQYVDPLIGTAFPVSNFENSRGDEYVSSGLTIPSVSAPFGMTQWTLQSQSTEQKGIPPFFSGRIRFQGFRGTHWLNGSRSKDYGSFTVFPTSLKGSYRFLPGQRETMYMYNSEFASPAYFSILMPEANIITELTATKRSAIFKFSWLTPNLPAIIIDINSDNGKGFIKVDRKSEEIYGYNPVSLPNAKEGTTDGFAGYFVAKFDTKIVNSGTYTGMDYEFGVNQRKNMDKIGAFVTFDLNNNLPVKMKIGTSFTSIENARKNLDSEISAWDFNNIKTDLEKTWNEILGRIEIESDNLDEQTKFYSSFYRSLLQPRLFSDVNGEYCGFADDTVIHIANGFEYYGDFATESSYRTQMPLLSLVVPDEYTGMIKSLIAKAEQGGWLPSASLMNNYSSVAVGDFSATIIADACMQGFDFDYNKAYYYLQKNAFELPELIDYNNGKGRRNLDSYIELGYIPLEEALAGTDKNGGQVSQTLEYAYNDWCVAQMAKKLGKMDDYKNLLLRSYNYSNLFDLEKNFVCGKFADDTFTNEFNASTLMPYLTEGTPEQYSFFAPHDAEGLIEIMGGKNQFQQKLIELVKHNGLWPGNEPSQQIPYLFNAVENWGETQKVVKDIVVTQYGMSPEGLSRNDNAGQMSAWYVFSSIGFYPTCPGSNSYQLSAPIFDKVTLKLDKKYYHGKRFTIEAKSSINRNPFTKVEWNGKDIEPMITHENIRKGGKLVFSGNQ